MAPKPAASQPLAKTPPYSTRSHAETYVASPYIAPSRDTRPRPVAPIFDLRRASIRHPPPPSASNAALCSPTLPPPRGSCRPHPSAHPRTKPASNPSAGLRGTASHPPGSVERMNVAHQATLHDVPPQPGLASPCTASSFSSNHSGLGTSPPNSPCPTAPRSAACNPH